MKTKANKRIIVSVTNDLTGDNRVHKVCSTLTKMGFTVLLVGRRLKKSKELNQRTYKVKRMKLIFNKGLMFYAEYNIRLFVFLLFSQYNLLLSNDLDTLTANFIASAIRRKPLIYDSHEYFTEVPELINRPAVKKIWEWIEGMIIPRLSVAYTVCESIAAIYQKKYGTVFKVVRNVPFRGTYSQDKRTEINTDQRIILYQGAVNIGRGLEQTVEAVKHINNARFVIAGDGDIKNLLEEKVQEEQLLNKIQFMGMLPLEQLVEVTAQADLGISVEEDLGLNYRYALPNKLFDYIQAHVPVLVTNLPEMAAIVKKYNIGMVCNSVDPQELQASLQEALFNDELRKVWYKNLHRAASELVWEHEEMVLEEIFRPYL